MSLREFSKALSINVVANLISPLLITLILAVGSWLLSSLLKLPLDLILTAINTFLLVLLIVLSVIAISLRPSRQCRRLIGNPGGAIFVLEGNKRRHIPDPQTLSYLRAYLGLQGADIERLSDDEVRKYDEEPRLPSIRDYCPREQS